MALRLRLAQKLLGENAGLRLASKRGCVVKKHLQARLRVSFPQYIQHSHSESHRIFYLPIRVYLGNPWLKIFSREEAQSSYAACGSGVRSYCVAGGAWWRRTDG
jgi:hypothetical protein